MAYKLGQEWQEQAGCRGSDPEAFVPSGSGRPRREAKQICATCPVHRECKEFVLSSPWRPFGTWAGMSQRELGALWHERHLRSGTSRAPDFVGLR